MSKIRLTPALLHLLLSLAEGPSHGYALLKDLDDRTEGRIRLGPSSLYYSLGRLEDAGLIEEAEVEPPSEEPHGDQRRYYALTEEGRTRLQEETEVLAGILAHARAQGLTR